MPNSSSHTASTPRSSGSLSPRSTFPVIRTPLRSPTASPAPPSGQNDHVDHYTAYTVPTLAASPVSQRSSTMVAQPYVLYDSHSPRSAPPSMHAYPNSHHLSPDPMRSPGQSHCGAPDTPHPNPTSPPIPEPSFSYSPSDLHFAPGTFYHSSCDLYDRKDDPYNFFVDPATYMKTREWSGTIFFPVDDDDESNESASHQTQRK